MLKHGGRFENYFSRHTVTHIICSNLPDSKIKNLRFAFLLTTYTIHFILRYAYASQKHLSIVDPSVAGYQ